MRVHDFRNVAPPGQPKFEYAVADVEEGDTAYYGMTNHLGNWVIIRGVSEATYRYAKGVSAYITNWNNRASLDYDYYHNIF